MSNTKNIKIHLVNNNNGKQDLEAIYVNGVLHQIDYTVCLESVLWSLRGYTIESVTSDVYDNEQMEKMNNTFPTLQKDLVETTEL